jgi:hypothetical protein
MPYCIKQMIIFSVFKYPISVEKSSNNIDGVERFSS